MGPHKGQWVIGHRGALLETLGRSEERLVMFFPLAECFRLLVSLPMEPTRKPRAALTW